MAAVLRFLPAILLAGQAVASPKPASKHHGIRVPFALGDERGPLDKRTLDKRKSNPSTGTNNKIWVSIGVGTPPQDLNFLVDSGADDFAVSSVLAPNNGASLGDQPKYDPSKSSSASQMNGYTWQISYGNGGPGLTYGGPVYTETVTINGQTFSNIPLLVESYGGSSTNDRAGNLGLDANKYAPTSPGGVPSFLQAIKGQLASGQATAAYHYQYSLNQGGIDFGFINSSLYVNPLHYHPITSGQTEWQLTFDGIYAGGKYVAWSFIADLDFGGPAGTLPRFILDTYFAQVSGAYFDSSYNTYRFPCTANLPPMSIIINSNNVSPPAENWVDGPLGLSGYTCTCMLTADSDAHTGFLGQPFLTGIYVVFDQDKNQVGLANRPTLGNPITDVTPQNLSVITCTGAGYGGNCTGFTTQTSACQPLTGQTSYHAWRSFITVQGGCVVYSDTGCASPLYTTAQSSNKDLGAATAAKVGSFTCFGPDNFPPRGNSSFVVNDQNDFVGNTLNVPWNSYECHNLPSSWYNKVKSLGPVKTGYCFIYSKPNCQGIIGNGEPYVTPSKDSTQAATYMKSWLCY